MVILGDPNPVSALSVSSVFDPVRYTQDLTEALHGADCAVLVTRHREYLGPELLQAAQGQRIASALRKACDVLQVRA